MPLGSCASSTAFRSRLADLRRCSFLTLLLESIAALAMGLLASAAVADAAQATLALPMLRFPQVLFAGAIVPAPQMALPGRLISLGMANRWAFESLGLALPLHTHSGGPTLAPYRTPSPVRHSPGGWC